jgi:lipid-binding SYLF domain-containing protein
MMLFGALLAAGCAHAPKTEARKMELENKADEAVARILNRDAGVKALLDQAAGYIVFPEVKEGGFIVGGAGAQGVIYQGGRPVGFADLSRVSVGALAGGQRYHELVIVRDQSVLDALKGGSMDVGAKASATILKTGASAQTTFNQSGVAVIVYPLRGAMVNASLAGQRIRQTSRM